MKPEQAVALRTPFPPSTIGQLPRGNTMLDYVGHAAVTDRLLQVDPEWNWEPVAFNAEGEPLIVVRGNVCRLWIRLTVCGVTRLGCGTVLSNAFDVEKQLIGDAIRNAAMRFGVALDLWSKEELPHFEATAGPHREVGSMAPSEPSGESVPDAAPAVAPFMVGQSTLDALQARVSALLADKAPVTDSRKARGLPPLKHPLTDEQGKAWEALIADLETSVTVSKIVPA